VKKKPVVATLCFVNPMGNVTQYIPSIKYVMPEKFLDETLQEDIYYSRAIIFAPVVNYPNGWINQLHSNHII